MERIAVVGAGIIGCAVAFELSSRGAAVTVFDRRRLGGGATQASAGILAPYTEAHAGGALFDLTVRGLEGYDHFVDRVRAIATTGFEYRRSGTLEVAEDTTRATELSTRLQAPWAASAGLQWVDDEALQVIAPFVARSCLGGLVCPAQGFVAVSAFVAALAEAIRTLGGQFALQHSISRVERRATAVVLHSEEDTRAFDRVILCAGAWTPAVDPLSETDGRIRPIRGQLIRLAATQLTSRHVLWGRDCYIVPWDDGTVLVGATSEDVGFDERATVDGVGGLLRAAEALVPALGTATFLDVRVGLRPAGIDGVPILGPGTDPRVIYAAGHFRNGILLAPLTATLIADYVFDGTVDPAFSRT